MGLLYMSKKYFVVLDARAATVPNYLLVCRQNSPSAIVLYRYGYFVPFNRLANIQKNYGVPLPASVQWQRAEIVANCLLPVFLYLQLIAATGETLYQDDTKCRILRPLPQISDKRTGLFTTGLVIEYGEWKIALYASGRKHAGENAAELLAKRPKQMQPINKMSDGSNMNNSPNMSANLLNCLARNSRNWREFLLQLVGT